MRLLLELFLFMAAVVGLYVAEYRSWALVLGALVVIHYAVSWERTGKLARNVPLA